jgi:hypothetical protein
MSAAADASRRASREAEARPPALGTRHLRMPRPGCGDPGFHGGRSRHVRDASCFTGGGCPPELQRGAPGGLKPSGNCRVNAGLLRERVGVPPLGGLLQGRPAAAGGSADRRAPSSYGLRAEPALCKPWSLLLGLRAVPAPCDPWPPWFRLPFSGGTASAIFGKQWRHGHGASLAGSSTPAPKAQSAGPRRALGWPQRPQNPGHAPCQEPCQVPWSSPRRPRRLRPGRDRPPGRQRWTRPA